MAGEPLGVAGGSGRLGPGSRRILRSICEAFLPAGGAFPQGAEGISLAEKVEAHIVGVGPAALPLVALLLRWIELQPLLFHLRPRRFQRLGLDERVRVLEAMEQSRWLPRRQPVLLLKLLLALHGYRDGEVAAGAGRDAAYLEGKLREAEERRRRGGKGPYPQPEAPPAPPATGR